MVNIPDGFGGLKLVDLEAETEFAPFIEDDVHFMLFTRQNPTVGQVIRFNDMQSVQNSNFGPHRLTVFMAHGWGGSGTGGINTLLRNAYLGRYDCNVIAVDWSVGAGHANYITSRNLVIPTGAHIATFVNNLAAADFIDYHHVTCCGHSLGAHVCGGLGKNTRLKIGNVYGLDPAGPLFLMGNPATRLDAGDAHYVENCHTDINLLGIGNPIGHVDYYPNGGENQPGCSSSNCDHGIAPHIHADTINNRGLVWGRDCGTFENMRAGNCNGAGFPMGVHHPENQGNPPRGVFRMNTNQSPPMGQGPF